MKRLKSDKFNITISFTPSRLKLGHSYGYDKAKFYTTCYMGSYPDPHWAAEQITKEIGLQLKLHADQLIAKRKGAVL